MYYYLKDQARKKLRLSHYNYRKFGYYFVTLCTEGRLCLFGEIVNGKMFLNAAGKMIHSMWAAIPNHFLYVQLDAFVIMPNHVHAIIVLDPEGIEDQKLKSVWESGLQRPGPAQRLGPAQRPAPTCSLPEIMRDIKSYTTFCYSQGVYEQGFLKFEKRLWQRSYHEHIIRNNESLNKIRQYIFDNPIKWNTDRNRPM